MRDILKNDMDVEATKEGKRVGGEGQEGHFKGPNQVSEPKRGEI